MAKPKGLTKYEVNKRRDELQSYIKSNLDGDGYLLFKCREYSEEHGVDKSAVVRNIKFFADQGLIEYESMRKDGYLIHYLNIDDSAKKNKTELKVDISNPPCRKCPKCGFEAPSHYAKFCWNCGASLLSEKEQLREEFRTAIGKIYRLSTDSKAVNEIIQTMAKVDNFIFSEVEGDV